jgi:hypothetical protein
MNLVKTWVRSPLEVCVRILLHGTGHTESRIEKKDGKNGTVFVGKKLWEKPGRRLGAFILLSVVTAALQRRAFVSSNYSTFYHACQSHVTPFEFQVHSRHHQENFQELIRSDHVRHAHHTNHI